DRPAAAQRRRGRAFTGLLPAAPGRDLRCFAALTRARCSDRLVGAALEPGAVRRAAARAEERLCRRGTPALHAVPLALGSAAAARLVRRMRSALALAGRAEVDRVADGATSRQGVVNSPRGG